MSAAETSKTQSFDTLLSSAADTAAATVRLESEVALVATSAFDDFGGQQYDKLWRISVLRVIVSFLFRIPILWINARGIWYPVEVR